MDLPLYVVDAFTDRLFRGNPAAVCPLTEWLPEALMQSLAAENNLAETAFVVPEGDGWGLRWFTPRVEVDLCGHATLATAFILARLHPEQTEFRFQTRSGELVVTRAGDLFTLDFPARDVEALAPQPALETALGARVLNQYVAANVWIAELTNEAAVQALQPDLRALQALDCRAVSVTARGQSCDFVSRFFAPKAGIDEDPVTGSAHCGLVPLWAERVGRTQLGARQLSARGGELLCELRGQRVLMSGRAVLYSTATVHLP
ncbi:MAG: PhzF family phenazine biosynthesis protein [Pseudomonadota bacterium]|nr:PhzF family phenazine biosynthesis protein [Pseudomonadota bacterium]